MNERIKELADEAFVTVSSDGYFSSGKFCEKFAELIVRECAGVVIKEMNYDAGECCAKILEHFGVEE
jgi:peroxiredoxin